MATERPDAAAMAAVAAATNDAAKAVDPAKQKELDDVDKRKSLLSSIIIVTEACRSDFTAMLDHDGQGKSGVDLTKLRAQAALLYRYAQVLMAMYTGETPASAADAKAAADVAAVTGARRSYAEAFAPPAPNVYMGNANPMVFGFPFVGQYKRRNSKSTMRTNYACAQCQTMDTPEWRRGPLGPKTLCNACGLQYAKKLKRMGMSSKQAAASAAQQAAAAAAPAPAAAQAAAPAPAPAPAEAAAPAAAAASLLGLNQH